MHDPDIESQANQVRELDEGSEKVLQAGSSKLGVYTWESICLTRSGLPGPYTAAKSRRFAALKRPDLPSNLECSFGSAAPRGTALLHMTSYRSNLNDFGLITSTGTMGSDCVDPASCKHKVYKLYNKASLSICLIRWVQLFRLERWDIYCLQEGPGFSIKSLGTLRPGAMFYVKKTPGKKIHTDNMRMSGSQHVPNILQWGSETLCRNSVITCLAGTAATVL